MGYVKLTSPTISLNDNQIYSVNLSLWWKNLDGTGTPDDTLFVRFKDIKLYMKLHIIPIKIR